MFYTVRELSELLEVSKPTIQKVINDNSIEADRIEKNKFRYYSSDKAAFITRIVRPDFDVSLITKEPQSTPPNTAKQTENIDKPPKTPQNLSENIEKSPSQESIDRMLSIIEQQLAEKNRMLAQKDKEIQELREQAERERTDLQNKLAAAYSQISEMAQKAQYITAADKTVQIMDKQSKEEKAAAEVPAEESEEAGVVEEHESPATPVGETGTEETIEQAQPQKENFLSKLLKLIGR